MDFFVDGLLDGAGGLLAWILEIVWTNIFLPITRVLAGAPWPLPLLFAIAAPSVASWAAAAAFSAGRPWTGSSLVLAAVLAVQWSNLCWKMSTGRVPLARRDLPSPAVACVRHGWCEETFVCHHLARWRDGRRRGFHPGSKSGARHAWCSACETVRARSGRWTTRAEKSARVSSFCESCYDEAKALARAASELPAIESNA